MKRLKSKNLFATTALMAAMLPNAAYACCESVSSCIGAFVSGGLSCVVEAAINQANDLRRRAQDSLGEARRSYEEINNDINSRLNDGKAQAEAAQREALSSLDSSFSHIESMLRKPKLVMPSTNINTTMQQPAAPAAGMAIATVPGLGAGGGAQPNSSTNSTALPSGKGIAMGSGSQRADRAVAAPSASAVAAMVTPVDEEDVRRTLQRAQEFVDAQRNQARSQHAPRIGQLIGDMERKVQDDLRSIGSQLQRSVFDPLEGFLRQLSKYDPTGIVALVASIVSGIDTALTAITNISGLITNVDQSFTSKLDELAGPVNTLNAMSGLAQQIEQSVKKLLNNPTQSELNKLKGMLPAQPRTIHDVAMLKSLHATTSAGSLRTFAVKRSLSTEKIAMTDAKNSLSKLSAHLKSPLLTASLDRNTVGSQVKLTQYKSSAERMLEQEFAGLSPAQKAAKQQQILSDVKSRLGNDLKAQQDAERMINNATGLSVRSNMAVQPLNAASAPMLKPANQIPVNTGPINQILPIGR